MLIANQIWMALQTLIQESFQQCLNTAAPMAGHHGYAPAQPFQQNAFGILGEEDDDEDKELITNTMATQAAALTYQSQLMQSMTANTSQHQEQQMAQIVAVQSAMHDTLHHIIAQLNALLFNASDAGHGRYVGHGYNGQRCGRSHAQGRGCGPPTSIGSFSQGGGVCPMMGTSGRHASIFPPGPPGGFLGSPAGGPPPYHAPSPMMNRGCGPPGGIGIPPAQAHVHQQPYSSNIVKRYANWNTCYSCGFDVVDGHTSMSCPPHLRKATHHIGFNRQNAQQYIDLGHPCSARNRHKTQFPTTM
jgi:hypothetical protein